MTLSLNTPTEGDTDWADDVNQNFTDIQAAVNGLSVLPSTTGGRLSASVSSPVGEASSSGTIYFHPFVSEQIAIFDGTSTWSLLDIPTAGVSLALSAPGTANLPHDVFAFDSSGTLTLELTAWTSTASRATSLVRQDGVLVRSGATTRRFLGTIHLDGSKQVTDSAANRVFGIWNVANRVRRTARISVNGGGSYTYAGTGIRKANNSSTADVSVTKGRDDLDTVRAQYLTTANIAVGTSMVFTVGRNGASSWSETSVCYLVPGIFQAIAIGEGALGLGFNTLSPLESKSGGGTNTMGGSATFHVQTWQ